jgi:hypothetical protein
VPVPVFVPETAVTVMVYVPGVVPPDSRLVHPTEPAERAPSNRIMPSMVCHLRLRAGMPASSTQAQARIAPLAGNQGARLLPDGRDRDGLDRDAWDMLPGETVLMVREAVPVFEVTRLTGLVEPKLKTG